MQNEDDNLLDKDILHALALAVFSELQDKKGDNNHESSGISKK
jgi:hypothetical protein